MASDIEVGKRIRALRKNRGISLQQMANDTGMSYSYLSGLENGKHSVSITNLQRVANFFNVDMVYFLQPVGPVPRLLRKEDLLRNNSGVEDIYYRVMTPPESSHLQISYIQMPPNAPTERRIHKHGRGQELVKVIEGAVVVMVEGERYLVERGDSLLFEADVEHLIFTEDRPAAFAIVSSPPYGQKVI